MADFLSAVRNKNSEIEKRLRAILKSAFSLPSATLDFTYLKASEIHVGLGGTT